MFNNCCVIYFVFRATEYICNGSALCIAPFIFFSFGVIIPAFFVVTMANVWLAL